MKNCRRLRLNQDIVHIPHSYLQLKSMVLPIFFAFHLAQSQNRRKIQLGRDLRISLVQPPAQFRVSEEVKPCCLGLYPIGLQKIPGMETAQHLGATCSTAVLSSWGKRFPFISSLNFSLQLMLIISLPATMHCCGEPASVFSVTYL